MASCLDTPAASNTRASREGRGELLPLGMRHEDRDQVEAETHRGADPDRLVPFTGDVDLVHVGIGELDVAPADTKSSITRIALELRMSDTPGLNDAPRHNTRAPASATP